MDRRLWWALGAAGGLTLLAAAQPQDASSEDVVGLATRPKAAPAGVDASARSPSERDQPHASGGAPSRVGARETAHPALETSHDREAWPPLGPEAARAWRAPPPPPAPSPPPPAPPAVAPPPPFPYQWLGQLEDDSGIRFFLGGPQRTLTLQPGDAIDRRWRIEGVREGRLRVTWLASGVSIEVAPR